MGLQISVPRFGSRENKHGHLTMAASRPKERERERLWPPRETLSYQKREPPRKKESIRSKKTSGRSTSDPAGRACVGPRPSVWKDWAGGS